VITIDPTPRAIRYVSEKIAGLSNIRLVRLGLWSRDETLRFFVPRNPRHVSHSIVNLQRTDEFFEAPCVSVSTLMGMLGHTHITILKLDIEGAQYEVLRDVLDRQVPIDVICVEFDQPSPIRQALDMLKTVTRAGYRVVSIEGVNFTFVMSTVAP
jgi:FkbM family methyltransferase